MKRRLSEKDHEYMDSMAEALSEHTPKKMRVAIYFWLIAVIGFVVWASLADVDEVVRGSGKVVPSGNNQIVQNLEGGIVKAIYVKVGDSVKKGDPLLKIENEKAKAQMLSTKIKIDELEAKRLRLYSQANGLNFNTDIDTNDSDLKNFLGNEKSLFISQKEELNSKIASLKEKKNQKIHSLTETEQRVKDLNKTADLMQQEINMMRPMVKQGVKSKVDFMHLQREQSKIMEELHSAVNSIPSIKSEIREITHQMDVTDSEFQNKAKEQLNEVKGELLRLKESYSALQDEVNRTIVRSPINGIVQNLYIHTIGGVIKPGGDLVEIVPTDDKLWLEVKIKPSDIAFIYPGQKAVVKISAYDFAIYGSLEGKVVHISADTTKDEKDRAWYIVHIRTDKNYLGSKDKPLKIIPGMTASVDIVTGKKTVMDYIMKPILRAKEYTFTER